MIRTQYMQKVDEVALVMIEKWAEVEGQMPNSSYIATFADMARAVVDKYKLDMID